MMIRIKSALAVGAANIILTSCSPGFQAAPPSPVIAQSSARAFETGTLRAEGPLLKPPAEFGREVCDASGGTWTVPQGKNPLVSGGIAYGPNDCPKKNEKSIEIGSRSVSGTCYQVGPGYLSGPFTIQIQALWNTGFSFAGKGLTVSLTSAKFDPSVRYTIAFETPEQTILEDAGRPHKGTLTFPSVFERGFGWGRRQYVFIQPCYPVPNIRSF